MKDALNENTANTKEPGVYDENLLQRIIDFLEDIGIHVSETTLEGPCILPGLGIKENCILVDRARLKYPGDLLHEAGHIAVTPKEVRIVIGTEAMDPSWPNDGEEIAAILWSYAALRFLDLKPEVVFHEEGYKNESEWLIQQFNNGNYIGIPLLEWMGLCHSPEKEGDFPAFPHMIKWLR